MDSSLPPAAVLLAQHAAARRDETLSERARSAIRAFTLDTVSVGVAGAGSRYAPIVRAFVARNNAASEAHIWGFGDGAVRRDAAFANAFLAHCQEFDCVHEAAVLHPFTVVVPVLCAEAEATGAMDGATFMAACAAGVDVAAGLGVAATSPIKFFRPATCGLFGAIAALGRARGLSSDVIAHAFGYGLAFASGTMQAHSEGTPALAIQVANAARCAFDAVDLAAAGLPGPLGSIDGAHGYLSLFETSFDRARLLQPLSSVTRAEEVSWKPYPTGRAAHGGLDMMRRALAQGVRPGDIETIKIEAPPLIHHLVGRPIQAPLEVNYARLCLPYLAATLLLRGQVSLAEFAASALNDAEVHALASRIEVLKSNVADPAAFVPQRAQIAMKSGTAITMTVETLPGSPSRPLSDAEQREKAMLCFAFADAPGSLDALMDACAHLQTLSDCSILSRIASRARD